MVGAAGQSGNPDHGKVYPRTAGILDREAGSTTKAHSQATNNKGTPFHRPVQKPIDFLDYPFFTITIFPPGYLGRLTGRAGKYHIISLMPPRRCLEKPVSDFMFYSSEILAPDFTVLFLALVV